jgi:hypothetical protein
MRERLQEGARLFFLRSVHDAPRQELAAKVRQSEPRARRAEIDRRHEPMPAIEFHVHRSATAPRGTGAQVGEQACPNQGPGQAADSGRRQPCRLDQLCAAERAFVRHRRGEDALEIQPSQVGGVTRDFQRPCRMPHR